jgi:DNA invertase Pin-like site-specific DNA recombinase
MATGNFVAYYRVSTAQQGRSGLGLEAQQQAVRAYLDGGCWKLIGEHTEVESGKLRDRPQLKAALEQCRLTGATLVIAKLDRLSRNVAFLAQLMDSTDVQFVAVDNQHANRFTLHILAAVAEHEALQISARTKVALAAARARGKALGGWRPTRKYGEARTPPGTFQAAATAATKAKADERAARVLPIARELQAQGKSLRQIASELTERHVTTPRGGPWSATSVRNLLQRDRGGSLNAGGYVRCDGQTQVCAR